jgi:hypothetical protein
MYWNVKTKFVFWDDLSCDKLAASRNSFSSLLPYEIRNYFTGMHNVEMSGNSSQEVLRLHGTYCPLKVC